MICGRGHDKNVVLELGMVLSRLGRRQVAILVKGDEIEKTV